MNAKETTVNTRRFWTILCAALCVLMICGISVCAAAEESNYLENEWNFVEESMSTAGGIPDDAAGVLGRIERNGVLRVAADPNLAPRVFLDSRKTGDDRFAGADIRLATLIAERMGVRLKIVALESTQIMLSLTEDQCDLAISAIGYTPGRALAYTMSKGYDDREMDAIGLLIREENRDTLQKTEDLQGKVIVAQSNSMPEATAVKLVGDYLEFRRLSTAQAVFEAVAQGKADAGFVSIPTAEIYIRNHPESGLCLAEGLSFVPDAQYQGSRVVAKKGETQLIAFVNGVIDEVLEKGLYSLWLEESGAQAAELGIRP